MKINKKWLLLAFVLTLAAVFLVSTGDVGAYTGIDGGYVGSTVCGTCHTAQKADFDKSGHSFKYRYTGGATPGSSDPVSMLLTSSGNNTIADITAFNASASVCVDTTPADGKCDVGSAVDADADGKLDWSAVNYVVGGWGWKARWGILDASGNDLTGFVWSSGSTAGAKGAQYNMLAFGSYDPLSKREDWSKYGSATGQSKAYNCAVCHNTNGTNAKAGDECTIPFGSGRTEPWAKNSGKVSIGAPGGYLSEWTFDSVQCEACHGAGEMHSNAPSASNITSNTSLTACGQCHTRHKNDEECFGTEVTGGALTNGSADGFVKHHEQYNEMVGWSDTDPAGKGVHAILSCVTCHDPHKRSHKVPSEVATALGITDNNLSAKARGAVVDCASCHEAQKNATGTVSSSAAITAHNAAGVDCIDCHMAEATKSGTGIKGTWGKKGDDKTHIFKINPLATAATVGTRTNANGKTIAENYLSTDYACGKCHDSGAYEGGFGTILAGPTDKATAETSATNYHNVTGIDNGYVGSNSCAGCHTAKYDSFVQTGHPYKIRTTKGKTPFDDGTCVPGAIVGSTICDPISALLPMPFGSDINTLTLGDGCYDPILNPTSKFNCDANGKLDWSAVQYVIGGYGWKARWGLKDEHTSTCSTTNGACKTGYIVVGADAINGNNNGTQYNVMSADTSIDPGNPGHVENWSDYNNNTDKGYDCAICHNTNGAVNVNTQCTTTGNFGYRTQPWTNMGWTPSGAGNITSPAGFKSEWTFDGVQCEACHGAKSSHVKDGSTGRTVLAITDSTATGISTTDIVADSGYDAALSGNIEICAKCHMRGSTVTGGKEWGCAADKKTLRYGAEMQGATGTTGPNGNYNADFQKHHEQYNELVGYNPSTTDFDPAHGDGAHKSLTCTTCHDPHQRSHKLTAGVATALGVTDRTASPGVITTCESCHNPGTPNAAGGGADKKVNGLRYPMRDIKCVDCHMGETIRSAPTRAEIGTWGKKGDVKSHVFRIDTTSTSILRTNADGKPIAQNYITVDYACGKCHDSTMNDYIVGSVPLTKAMAQSMAVNMHPKANAAPTADFTTPTINGFQVSIGDLSSDDAALPANAITVRWGDGSNYTQVNAGTNPITHTYTTAGTFNIVYTVKDAGSLYDTKTASVAVTGNKNNITVSVTTNPTGSSETFVLRYNGSTKDKGTGVDTKDFGNRKPSNKWTVKVRKDGYSFDCGAGTNVWAPADNSTGPATVNCTATQL
jgi:hypothetical protein